MQDFNTVGGRIIEILRYVTPFGLYGQDARRELSHRRRLHLCTQ